MLAKLPSLRLVGFLILALVFVGLGWYVYTTKNQLQVALLDNDRLKLAISQNEAAIDQLNEDYRKNEEALRNLFGTFQSQNQELAELTRKLNRSSATGQPRDLGQIARQRAQAVERLVNKGSVEAARCIELATGAERTPEELAATKPSEVNSLCPSLANPRFIP
jgi:uncharacterized protein HemX